MAIKQNKTTKNSSHIVSPQKKKKPTAPILPQEHALTVLDIGKSIQGVERLNSRRAKYAKESLQNHEMFYTLFHSNPIPTMLTRLDNKTIIDVNLAFLEYLHLQREDVIGHTVQEFNAVPKQIKKTSHKNNIRNHEAEVTLPSGEKKTMLTSTQLIHIENTDAILSTFIDITDHVRVEQQIRNLTIERTSAELNERRRIARLLHDDLQQRIFAIKMHLERLEEGFARNDMESAKEDFAKLEAWLIEAIAMTRKLSSDISPLSVSGGTLSEVILWLANEMKEQYGLETKFEENGVCPALNSSLLSVLLQAMRELLFNVIKHAETNQVTIRLEKETRRSIWIIVKDAGQGFDTKDMSKSERTGGLTNIRQQLSIFGCSLDLFSVPGNGTRAIIGVPLRKSEPGP